MRVLCRCGHSLEGSSRRSTGTRERDEKEQIVGGASEWTGRERRRPVGLIRGTPLENCTPVAQSTSSFQRRSGPYTGCMPGQGRRRSRRSHGSDKASHDMRHVTCPGGPTETSKERFESRSSVAMIPPRKRRRYLRHVLRLGLPEVRARRECPLRRVRQRR